MMAVLVICVAPGQPPCNVIDAKVVGVNAGSDCS